MPILVPLAKNCTLATAPLAAVAAAVTVMPELALTVEPAVGAVIATVGGVNAVMVTFTVLDVAVLPLLSVATAVSA